jgi:phosphatidylserine decarboxylase
MAVRTRIDIYTENVRKITYIESECFGRVAYGAVGAMMVGSIVLTTESKQSVKRGDEHGYFAFGGSTILVFFEKGRILFDPDLRENSRMGLETLVRVGNSLGVAV